MDFLKDLNLDKVRNLAEDAFNQAKPKTEVEARVYEVLSHKNWGSSSTIMNEIARDTYDYDKFAVISQITWESLENQRPAAWRLVFKGLTLLEHLIKNGSERCVDDARNHGHVLRSLHQFNYYEGTVDRGAGVREKSKQIVELLADDERIREERMKARKLREKFGGNIGAVSNRDVRAGYGNDGWESSGRTGGYGDGGIGSKSTDGASGRYGDERSSYAGRYDNDRDRNHRGEPEPTFAAVPEDFPKKSKTKKKKKKETDSEQQPEVDLFSFDAPAPVARKNDDEDFGDFSGAAGTPVAVNRDPFAATAPVQQQSQFDAFGGSADGFNQPGGSNHFDAFAQVPPTQQSSSQFEAFGSPPNTMASNNAFANNAIASPNTMGMQQQGTKPASSMGGRPKASGGGSKQPIAPADDDFGDFTTATQTSSINADPLSKLVSLDGLSKKTVKKEDKLNQPIIANDAAAHYIHEKDKIQESFKQASSKGSNMSFEGLDGLRKASTPGQMMSQPVSMGMNPSVMGTAGNNAIGSILDPSVMKQHGAMHGSEMASQGGGTAMHGQQTFNMSQQNMMGNQSMGMQGGMGAQGMGMQGNQGMGAQGMNMNSTGMGIRGNQGMGAQGMNMNSTGMGIRGNQGMGAQGMNMNSTGMGMQGNQGMGAQGMNNTGMGMQGNQGIGAQGMNSTGMGMHGNQGMGGYGGFNNFGGMQGQQNGTGGQQMGGFR